MKRYKHIIIAVIAALLAASCSFMHDDDVVARVGSKVLYKSQLDMHIPSGLPAEDSIAIARRFILNWASELVMNDIAMEQLSAEELDMSRELIEYRNSLLRYRYEQRYIADRLDTLVTEKEVEQQYKANPSTYTLSIPIAKARYILIAENSPMKDKLKKLLQTEDEDEEYLLDSLAHTSAARYTDFGGNWVTMVTIAREYGIDYGTLIASTDKNDIIDIVDEQGMEHITYLMSYIPSGKVAPMDYCEDKIREVIISKRKYVLSSNLEQDLLDNALKNGKFVIYNNNEQ